MAGWPSRRPTMPSARLNDAIVDHLGMASEIRHRIDHGEDLQHRLDAIQCPPRGLHVREQIQPAQFRGAVRPVRTDTGEQQQAAGEAGGQVIVQGFGAAGRTSTIRASRSSVIIGHHCLLVTTCQHVRAQPGARLTAVRPDHNVCLTLLAPSPHAANLALRS